MTGHRIADCSPGSPENDRILVTGASGYIGGRLVPRLLAAGYRVRCLVRSPEKLAARPWARDPRVEIFAGDLEDRSSTARAMRGCTVRCRSKSMPMPGRAAATANAWPSPCVSESPASA